ncbi:VOC family protein [Sphingomonas nostoxanthinifaciens]|uniref:VOC family protein n=1 Tax=Sphingomonas nostoxanthinifaciens TaxID=2872652 RepID=UPI001CC20A0F|nr:VOC family protein [Sphingomonas nostoxanthinifaciens]UAK23864.1 VOC family protein [Sphingomonas nostoxanthinifaciens]
MTLTRITGFRLVTGDLDRLERFYDALGFALGERGPIGEGELRLLGRSGTGERLTMRLGPSRIDLDRFDPPGRAYPIEANAADLVFQHLALVTDDAAAAWAWAKAAGAIPISRECPVTLPASSGGVTAVKFRDPDGHPLEFLQFPPNTNPNWAGSGILGIDHSAISVADLAASRRFYADHGLSAARATLNQGPAQVALDGLDSVVADVVPMHPAATPPHVELLAYRHPRGRAQAPPEVDDIVATRIVWLGDQTALLRDPDGHLHQVERG